LIACGPPRRDDAADDDDPAESIDAAPSPDSTVGCTNGTDVLYTVDTAEHLYAFDPPTKQFADLGHLSCPWTISPIYGPPSPFAMTVDHNAVAWLEYDNGELFTVDINHQMTCTKTGWQHQTTGDLVPMAQFGLGFVRDMPAGDTETLFIAGLATTGGAPPPLFVPKVAKLDTTSMLPSYVGTVGNGVDSDKFPELTGNGDAELWGFMTDPTTPHLLHYDKTNGAILTDIPEPMLARVRAGLAFTSWGGDYWVFIYEAAVTSTEVYQLDGTTGAIKSATPDTGKYIVGAGVAPCTAIIL
jgi:hypothetical protein